MLNLSLAAVARETVRVRDRLERDDPRLLEAGLVLKTPLDVDLEASPVGEGVLVRGELETEFAAGCRRCLVPVPVHVRDSVEFLFEPLTAEEELELGGEIYALPDRGDLLDLFPAIREHLLLRAPDFVVCSEECRGLCPRCGADLNRGQCTCVAEPEPSPWDALKKIRFE